MAGTHQHSPFSVPLKLTKSKREEILSEYTEPAKHCGIDCAGLLEMLRTTKSGVKSIDWKVSFLFTSTKIHP